MRRSPVGVGPAVLSGPAHYHRAWTKHKAPDMPSNRSGGRNVLRSAASWRTEDVRGPPHAHSPPSADILGQGCPKRYIEHGGAMPPRGREAFQYCPVLALGDLIHLSNNLPT